MATAKDDKPFDLYWVLTRFNLISFLPLFAVAAYWTKTEAILFVVSFMFPFLIALQELVRIYTAESFGPELELEEIDSLTGLPLRARALERMTTYLDEERISGRVQACLYIDLDEFRLVNARYGMAVGDKVLKTISDRISKCLRERDLLARVDGDTFVLILAPMQRPDHEAVANVAARIRKEVREGIIVDNIKIHVDCTIGICIADRAPDRTAVSVMGAAETAWEEAQRAGPGSIRGYSPKMRRESIKISHLSAELEAALENGQIRPHFQPQICTDTGQVSGFEALARWEHPDHGLILPQHFFRALGITGRFDRLNEVMLFHALSSLKAWERSGFRVPSVSINLSTAELRNPKLVERIKWEVDKFEVKPGNLTIEIRENAVSDRDDEVVTNNIRSLAAHGFCIDLDDFGTGQASIANIRRFAVSRIKIDPSFVRDIHKDTEQQILTQSIIHMTESLGLETVAEGVECAEEQQYLIEIGCRCMQGYHLARPMPFEETIAWLTAHYAKIGEIRDGNRKAG